MLMRKTSVLVDETLIKNALKATHMKSKKEVIEAGLQELIKKKNRNLLREELGSFEIELSLEELKKLRADQ
jgi:Arc/MetJ family transcription regulator